MKPIGSFVLGLLLGAILPNVGMLVWRAVQASTDHASRERELAADHTLIQDPAMMQNMARHFKRSTVLGAAFHLGHGKSVEETVELLQKESGDHPSTLTRWRAFQERLSHAI